MTATAVVNGGGGGIGRAVCLRLAEEGMAVAVAGRSAQSVEATVAQIERAGGTAWAHPVDLLDERRMVEAMASVAARGDGIDLLVNSAGIYREGPFETTPAGVVDELVGINLTGQVTAIRAVLPHISSGGSIVNVASMSAVRPLSDQAVYAAVKAAVVHLGVALAAELAPRGIRVNTVSPGPTKTGILETILPAEQIPGVQEQLAQSIPLGRLGQPAEVADAVSWLASAQYVTGAHVLIDGGTTL